MFFSPVVSSIFLCLASVLNSRIKPLCSTISLGKCFDSLRGVVAYNHILHFFFSPLLSAVVLCAGFYWLLLPLKT